MLDRRQFALVLLWVCPAIWSANYLVGRWAANWFPPHALAFARWSVGLIAMLCVCGFAFWRARKEVMQEWRDLLLLGALAIWLAGAVLYLGARTTTATNISVIYAGTPVLIMLLSALMYGERLRRTQVIGVGLAFGGVLAIVFKGDLYAVLQLRFTTGDLWILVAAIGWALYSVLLRYRPTRLPPLLRLAATTMAGLLILAPLTVAEAVLVGTPPLETRALVAALILGLLPGFAAFQAHSWLSKEIGATRTGLIFYLAPVYTAGLAFLLLGEPVGGHHLAGAALVFCGVYLATRPVAGTH